MVIDTSVLIAIFFKEKEAKWASAQLKEHSDNLVMSTVNLTELLIITKDRNPEKYQHLSKLIFSSGIIFSPPSIEQSQIAAEARLKYPINLGDCFAYALTKSEHSVLLTLDRDFLKTDLKIIIPG